MTRTRERLLKAAAVLGAASGALVISAMGFLLTSSTSTVCMNDCPDYAPSWVTACPAGQRCLTFTNLSPTETVALAYQIGCNSDGTKGAPQCDCTPGPTLGSNGGTAYFVITDGDYAACPGQQASWTPACLTAGLAVIANDGTAHCDRGTRFEFTAGNQGDPYGKFDSWNLDVEKEWYSIPVEVRPDLTCAVDHANHDCRPLWCGSGTCPDAYATPTTGGCADGRSPQVGCQDTFSGAGVSVLYHPPGCTSASCPSCLDAKPCP